MHGKTDECLVALREAITRLKAHPKRVHKETLKEEKVRKQIDHPNSGVIITRGRHGTTTKRGDHSG